jgi:hypothetical protein
MKTLKALLIVTLLGASVTAMAEGGGDRVMARMDAARGATMTQEQSAHAQAVVSVQKADSGDTARSN